MTEASAGLRKALARNAGVSKMSTEELLANLSDEQKTALAASLAPSADAKEHDDEEMGDYDKKDKSKKKAGDKDKDYMGDDEADADADASADDGTARAVAVMSSEHFAGREKLAADLLGNKKLSADEIVSILASSAQADPEAAARDEMRAALEANKGSNIEANDRAPADKAAAAANIWANATARVFGTNKTA